MVPKAETQNRDANSLLKDLLEQVRLVNQKLDLLIGLNGKIPDNYVERQLTGDWGDTASRAKLAPDTMALLSLPMSLRKTVMVLYKRDKATAKDLARETGRLRAVESSSANQLVRMGYLNKKREGRDVYFFIETSLESRKWLEKQ